MDLGNNLETINYYGQPIIILEIHADKEPTKLFDWRLKKDHSIHRFYISVLSVTDEFIIIDKNGRVIAPYTYWRVYDMRHDIVVQIEIEDNPMPARGTYIMEPNI